MCPTDAVTQRNEELLAALARAQVALQFYSQRSPAGAANDSAVARAALRDLVKVVPSSERCCDCGQDWDAHEFGVPRPYCL